jgi:hypothetical protein
MEQAHELRQRLWQTLEAETRQGGKPGSRPFSDVVDRDVQVLRAGIADIMGDDYKAAAKTYAQNEAVLREVAKIAGTTIDELDTKDRKLAEVLMRSLGNASDRPLQLIKDVTEAAAANGLRTDVDISTQLKFADLLERMYGSTQTRTLAGQVRTGVREANEDSGLISEAAQSGLVPALIKGGRNLMGQGEDDQLRAFEQYIRSLNRGGLINI